MRNEKMSEIVVGVCGVSVGGVNAVTVVTVTMVKFTNSGAYARMHVGSGSTRGYDISHW